MTAIAFLTFFNYFGALFGVSWGEVVGLDALFFILPLFFSASDSIHCICPLTERNSSSAHASIASIVALSTRRMKLLVVVSFFANVADVLGNERMLLYVGDRSLEGLGHLLHHTHAEVQDI